jgi:hypothetical protein
MERQITVSRETTVCDRKNSGRLQTIRRKIDVPDAVVAHEQIDDVFQFPPQSRLAPAEPQIGQMRHRFGESHDFIPSEIAGPVEILPIEAGIARGVAAGRDEENQRVQLAPSRETTVR